MWYDTDVITSEERGALGAEFRESGLATIYDVARTAGVSPKTVSRVLNREGPVGVRRRKAVEDAIAELAYVPSAAARMMRSNRSGVVGLITGALSHKLEPVEPTGLPDLYILHGIQQGIGVSEKTLMIADTGGRPENVPRLIRTFLQHRVEGLVYVADYHRQVTLNTGAADCPVLLVNCFDEAGTASVLPDDRRCQFDLVSELVRAGHRRIAYLTLDGALTATRLRLEGYRDALREAGLPLDDALVATAGSESGDDGSLLRRSLDALLSLAEPPTVLCCGNDEMALRVYELLRARGRRVPEDVSIAGFDNYRAIAETLLPPLTTVELPYLAMGRHAARTILDMVAGKAPRQDGPARIAGPVRWRSSVTAVHPQLRTETNRRNPS